MTQITPGIPDIWHNAAADGSHFISPAPAGWTPVPVVDLEADAQPCGHTWVKGTGGNALACEHCPAVISIAEYAENACYVRGDC